MTEKEGQSQEENKLQEHKKRKRGRRAYGTGSVFQRKDRKGKQWVAQMILEQGKIKQRYFHTQEEAAHALNEMLYEQRHGTLIAEKDQTVQQHFERWLELHKTKIRWSTYLDYRRKLRNHILPTLGHLSLQRLRAQDIDAFYARKLEEGYAPGTIEGIHLWR